jgi:hypothetical protein
LQYALLLASPLLITSGCRALTKDDHTLRLVLDAKRRTDGIYFFFYGPLSTPEWEKLIERPTAYDGAGEIARKGRVFWLDPDGTAHPIPVRQGN